MNAPLPPAALVESRVPDLIATHDGVGFLGLPLYDIALVVIGLSMLTAMVRLIRGPTLADRVVALDLLSFFAAGAIAIIAVGSERPELLMVAVVVALLTFMSTAAFALYLERQGRESADSDSGSDAAPTAEPTAEPTVEPTKEGGGRAG
jgi:multicomponent Na+:H+ antiporter subunit F